MVKAKDIIILTEDGDLLDKVYDDIYKDFIIKLHKLKQYVDSIEHRTTKKNIDDMINGLSDNLYKFAQEFKAL